MEKKFTREDFYRCFSSDPQGCWERFFFFWPLSPWIFKGKILENACFYGPVPSSYRTFLEGEKWKTPWNWQKGCAYVIFAIHPEVENRAPHLKKAFALPLLWKKNTAHSPCLPRGLKELADQILNQISPSSFWGLHLHLPQSCDISQLALDCSSGWAPLSASLYLALEGVAGAPSIWASGSWDLQLGIQNIGSLRAKMEVVSEMGGRLFFVPQWNLDQAKKIAKEYFAKPPTLGVLPAGLANPRDALLPYLQSLDCPPAKDRPLKERMDYYHRQILWKNPTASDYYLKNLLDELAMECRQRGVVGMDAEEVDKIENLITYGSLNPAGAFFVLSALKVKRVLLFYTEKSAKYLPWLKERIAGKGGIVETQKIEKKLNRREDEKITKKIQAFAEKYHPSKTALDLTPGPKDFTVVATGSLNPDRTAFLYLSHTWSDPGKVPKPGGEVIRRVRGVDG